MILLDIRIHISLKKDAPSGFRLGIRRPAECYHLLGDSLLGYLQRAGSFRLGAALAQEFGDLELLRGEPVAMKRQDTRNAIQDGVHIRESEKDAAVGALFGG
jgi:hypothetical protein